MAGALMAFSAANAALIAGVDFEAPGNDSLFDTSPDDYDPADGITVSSGGAAPVFNGWTLLTLTGGNGASGNLRNDGGATSAGATSPNFPARLEGSRTGSWSITVPSGVVLNLESIRFDVRGATSGTGRDGQFTTSLETAGTYLWENLNLPGRTSGGWLPISVPLSGSTYQGLTDQTVFFTWRTPTGAIDLDTIELYGSVVSASAIPETGSCALLLILGVVARRRRS